MSVLAALLDATPLPEGDADALLATFEVMIARRAAILAALEPGFAIPDAERPLFDELSARQAAWMSALEAARARLGEARVAASKLRAYG